MQTRVAVAAALVLAVGNLLPAAAQLPPPPVSPAQPCAPEPTEDGPHAPRGYSAMPTVLQVDHQQAIGHLATGRTAVVTFARPEGSATLREGARIQVCMAAAEAAEQLPPETDTDQE